MIKESEMNRAISRYVLYGELPNLDMANLLAFYAAIAQARKAIRKAEREFWQELESAESEGD